MYSQFFVIKMDWNLIPRQCIYDGYVSYIRSRRSPHRAHKQVQMFLYTLAEIIDHGFNAVKLNITQQYSF